MTKPNSIRKELIHVVISPEEIKGLPNEIPLFFWITGKLYEASEDMEINVPSRALKLKKGQFLLLGGDGYVRPTTRKEAKDLLAAQRPLRGEAKE